MEHWLLAASTTLELAPFNLMNPDPLFTEWMHTVSAVRGRLSQQGPPFVIHQKPDQHVTAGSF